MPQPARPGSADTIAQLLRPFRVRSTIYCRSSLRAPWGFAIDDKRISSFHAVIRGHCFLDLPETGERTELRAGDVVVMPMGPAHRVRDSHSSAAPPLRDVRAVHPVVSGLLTIPGRGELTELLCGGFEIEGREALPVLSLLPSTIVVRGKGEAPVPWLRPTFESLAAEMTSASPGAEAIVTKLSDLFLTQVMRHLLEQSRLVSASEPMMALRDRQIARALGLINDQPDTGWTVHSLAAAVAMSRSSFSVLFRKIAGQPPMRYLAMARLAKAAEELKTTASSCGEVAARAGYLSESSFSRAFKGQFGCSPGAYRAIASGMSDGPSPPGGGTRPAISSRFG